MTFNSEPKPASERQKGAATAHMLTTRAAENGRSADYIQQRHDELLGQFADDSTLSPATGPPSTPRSGSRN
jgi:hypothetical protein